MQSLLIVGVGGSKSQVGKTTFIEQLIKFIKNLDKTSYIVAIKYSKTTSYSSIIKEPSTIENQGKDTYRIKNAGADHVYLIKARQEDLPEIVEKLKNQVFDLFDKEKNLNLVIIEGNSLVRIMQPDVIIFIKDKTNQNMKPSAKAIFESADIVIEGDYSMEEIMEKIEKTQIKKLIERLLIEKSHNGMITCSEARKLAEDINVPYIEVGKTANQLKIKIRKCELGCF